MLRSQTRRPARRGNILIVTLALLSLMAVVGLTAFYFAKDQAENARIRGNPNPDNAFPDDGSNAFNSFLSTLIYDAPDSGAGLLNNMRGHSLAATMYGRQGGASIAWNGPGTFGGANSTGVDYRQLVNFSLFQGMGTIQDPEYLNAGGRAPAAAPGSGATAYYGKNPPYTYPDVKDFYLASICPATGEILVDDPSQPLANQIPVGLSFHRKQLFGSLAPGNANWTNAQGKYLTPRPRPIDMGPNFPIVPPNADGTYTGDVQNLPGGFGANYVAHNDSIWIDIGLQPFTLPGGRRIKPLVAPLILDLDGRLNLNIHGNVLNGGAHASGSGIGPHEVSLEKAIGLEGRSIVNQRGVPRTYAGTLSKSYNTRYPAGTQLPLYSAAPWNGFNGAAPPPFPLSLPGTGAASMFSTAPAYTNGYDSTNGAVAGHPTLFNPFEAGAGTASYQISENKPLLAQYAPYPSVVNQTGFGIGAPTLLGATNAPQPPNQNPPAQGTANPYRAHASHPNRHLFTTSGNSLDRTGLMPGAGGTTDPYAALGGIDLNRPLADYRVDPTLPLTPGNMTDPVKVNTANTDRQKLATDIFARLIASTGATGATINTAPPAVQVSVNGTATAGEITTLRNLAQLAVNIVDYIDNDDINTVFPWNNLSGEMVYGVEKPRLVINEAYSEVTNDPNDKVFTDANALAGANGADAQVRFWVELQNPTSQAYTVKNGGPLGDLTDPNNNGDRTGSAKVQYTAAELGTVGTFNPYQMLIVRNNKVPASPVINNLRPTSSVDPTYTPSATQSLNVAGDLPAGVTADITFKFLPANGTAQASIAPANGVANGGMVVLAPNIAMVRGPEYNPPAFASQISGTAVGGGDPLTYTIPLSTFSPPAQADLETGIPTVLGRHVILLRRLANPYLPGPNGSNPYITVDILDHVRAADRVLYADQQKMANIRKDRITGGGVGYEPNTQSLGHVQPYTSFADPGVKTQAGLNYPTNAMVALQTSATPVNGVQTTFGQQNSTLLTPYDWFVHMDRTLINQTELAHVTTGRPHDVTMNFITANTTRYSGSMQTVMLGAAAPQLYRALDLLRVQPYGQQTALGGRVPGRININTIQDIRVWRGLFDAQGYNGFTTTDVDNLWLTLMTNSTGTIPNARTLTSGSRTDATGVNPAWVCPIPGPTIYDTGATTGDRPFLPFGVATVPANAGATPGPTLVNAGTGLNDTLLRINPATSLPYLTTPGTHPYQNAEALRKILNNTTTVSHTFAVWLTVGYFEVESETPSGVAGVPNFTKLGKEYYREAPGDTRKKFFAIVDRSVLGNPLNLSDPPVFTTVEQNAASPSGTLAISTSGSGFVSVNGTLVSLIGKQVIVGVGANQEPVTLASVASYANGVTTFNLGAALTKNHYAGESVTNIMLGNPGPQPNFDVTQSPYQYIVPHWSRLQ